MTEQRKEIVGSYLMEEEAMNKVNWLKSEGYRPEEIWIIRDQRGVLEQLGEEPITSRSAGLDQTDYSNRNSTSSVVSPGSLLTPEEKSVATTLMELGIDKQEAYRYEFDVKVGKMLILADQVSPTSASSLHGDSSIDEEQHYSNSEDPALLMLDDEESHTEPGVTGAPNETAGLMDEPMERDTASNSRTERRMERDSVRISSTERRMEKDREEHSNSGSSFASGTSINKPLTDANIDGSTPLDEQLLAGDPVNDKAPVADEKKVEKDFAREEVISLHDQASVTHEPTTMHREESRVDHEHSTAGPNNGKRYAENQTEEDVNKALLYEHGQPFPMEKPYEEDVYDRTVIADGPLHVEEIPGDATTTEREEPLFRSGDEGDRPVSGLRSENSMPENEKGPILFEDTLNEIESDNSSMHMEPVLEDEAQLTQEQPGDLYTNEHHEEAELEHRREEGFYSQEGSSTYENESSIFEEESSDPFSSRKKERMNAKRSGLFDTEDHDLFKKR